jgi:hypothetical protein
MALPKRNELPPVDLRELSEAVVLLGELSEAVVRQSLVFVSASDSSILEWLLLEWLLLEWLPQRYYSSAAVLVERGEEVAVRSADAVSLSYFNCQLGRLSGYTNYIFTVFPNFRVRYHSFTTIVTFF